MRSVAPWSLPEPPDRISEGLWLPVNPVKATTPSPATAAETKAFWHKGAFWGDQDIRFKLPVLKPDQNLTLILGNIAPNQAKSAPPLTLTLKTDGANLLAFLTRGADLKIKDGSKKIEGSLENLPLEISRRGSYVIVRVGDEDAQSTLLAAKIVD